MPYQRAPIATEQQKIWVFNEIIKLGVLTLDNQKDYLGNIIRIIYLGNFTKVKFIVDKFAHNK